MTEPDPEERERIRNEWLATFLSKLDGRHYQRIEQLIDEVETRARLIDDFLREAHRNGLLSMAQVESMLDSRAAVGEKLRVARGAVAIDRRELRDNIRGLRSGLTP